MMDRKKAESKHRVAVLGRGAHTIPGYRSLLNELDKRYQVTVYSEVPVDATWYSLFHTYKVRVVVRRRYPMPIVVLLLIHAVIRDHWRKAFSVIHAHSTYPTGLAAVILSKLLRIPSIVCLDGGEAVSFPEIRFGDLTSNRKIRLNRWIINNADEVTALTYFQRDGVLKNLGVQRNIHVCPRGVLPPNERRMSRPFNEPIIFLSVSYLSEIKDPVTMLNTFAILSRSLQCRLVHVGEDYMNGSIQRLAAELNISSLVSFEGYRPHEEVTSYYKNADVLLLTSKFESQAVVVAEAMAHGLLVAGTHVGLMADLAGQCCITVAPGESELLAEKITNILGDPAHLKKMLANAEAWSKENTLEKSTNMLSSIYENAMRK